MTSNAQGDSPSTLEALRRCPWGVRGGKEEMGCGRRAAAKNNRNSELKTCLYVLFEFIVPKSHTYLMPICIDRPQEKEKLCNRYGGKCLLGQC